MPFVTLLLVAVGVSADAFAVAVARGVGMGRAQWRDALSLAVAFGVAQAGMVMLGWAAGVRFEELIVDFDHWVAFGLLGAIGAKMVWESFQPPDDEPKRVGLRELFILAIATSIDALAVGIAFAFLDTPIARLAALVGVATFSISLVGVCIARYAGRRLGPIAERAGGVVLIGIGSSIVVTHLGIV